MNDDFENADLKSVSFQFQYMCSADSNRFLNINCVSLDIHVYIKIRINKTYWEPDVGFTPFLCLLNQKIRNGIFYHQGLFIHRCLMIYILYI